jgi:hypothetical protein
MVKTKLKIRASRAGQANPESGQATTEYILILGVVVFLFVQVLKWVRESNFTAKVLNPIQTQFANTYQYGSPKAELQNNEYKNHPRVFTQGNFRIFFYIRR